MHTAIGVAFLIASLTLSSGMLYHALMRTIGVWQGQASGMQFLLSTLASLAIGGCSIWATYQGLLRSPYEAGWPAILYAWLAFLAVLSLLLLGVMTKVMVLLGVAGVVPAMIATGVLSRAQKERKHPVGSASE